MGGGGWRLVGKVHTGKSFKRKVNEKKNIHVEY